MTHAVIQYLGLPLSKVDLVREAIQSEWVGRIAFVWSRADVARICQFNDWAYPDADECDAVLTGLMVDATSKGICEADVIAQIKEQQLDRPIEVDEARAGHSPA